MLTYEEKHYCHYRYVRAADGHGIHSPWTPQDQGFRRDARRPYRHLYARNRAGFAWHEHRAFRAVEMHCGLTSSVLLKPRKSWKDRTSRQSGRTPDITRTPGTRTRQAYRYPEEPPGLVRPVLQGSAPTFRAWQATG